MIGRIMVIGLFIAFCTECMAQENVVKRLPEKPKRSGYRDYGTEDKGYWIAIEAFGGSMADVGRRCIPFAGASIVNGYRFNEFLRIGIGLGTKYYISNDDVRTSSIPWSFPLYADVRGNIISQNDRTIVPYWSIDIGAEVRNGVYFSPTFGARIGEARSSFIIGVSYQMVPMDTWRDKSELRNMFALKLGYEF